MTAEEVAVVHVAAAEEEEVMVPSSSSKVEIVLEKDTEKVKEKENNEKEDLSNDANGRIMKEDNDGDGDVDGSYVFVNGNDEVNGDPGESDLEKNGNGIGEEDQGFESLESKGVVESESDLVKDESRIAIGVVEQDNESIKLCHVEGHADETKSGDLVECGSGSGSAINVQDGVSETSLADQSGVSELPEGGLANGISEDIVSEAVVVDSSAKQSDEGSSVSVSDSNGGCLADQSEVSELPEGGLANGNSEHTIPEAAVVDSIAKQSDEEPIVSVSYSNGGCLADKDGVSEGTDDSLANGISRHTVSEAAHESNEGSSVSVSDSNGGCLADQSEVSELPEGGLANGNSEHTIPEAAVADSIAKQSDEEPIVSVSYSNGGCLADKDGVSEGTDDSLADGISRHTVSEAAHESNEVSSVSVSDSNGGSFANDSVEDNAVISRSKESTDSETNVTDNADCNGDGLAINNAEENIVDFKSKENDSEMAASDCNGDGLAAKSVEWNVVDFKSKENEDSEMAIGDKRDCKGDCLADINAKDTVSEGPADTRNELIELPVSDDGVSSLDGNGDGLPDITAKDTVLEAAVVDSSAEQNDGCPISVSDSSGNDLPADSVEDPISEVSKPVSNVNGDMPEQNGFSDMPKTVVNGGEILTTRDVVHVDSSLDLGHNSERDLSSVADTDLVKETEGVNVSEECGEALQDVHTQDGVSETVVIDDLVDSSQKAESSEIVESAPYSVKDENENVAVERVGSDATTDCPGASPDVVESSSSTVTLNKYTVESGISDTTTQTLLQSPVDDEKVETVETEGRGGSDSHHVEEDSEVEIKVESGSVLASEEAEVSKAQGGIQFGTFVTSQEAEGLDEVERKRPFYYLIRVPRFDDVNLKEQIRLAEVKVDEKTRSRDVIGLEMQSKKATCKEYSNNFDAAASQEKVARDLLKSKRQEIESIQSVVNIEDIDAKIRNMEHMIQHETLPLKDEKQFIREIKQLKQSRERLLSNMGKQDEVKRGLDQKDQIDERLKSLKKEADQLKVNLLKAEAASKAAKKILQDEAEKYNNLKSRFEAANNIRQEAYAQLLSLRKQSNEKNKHCWQYRDDRKTANNLALKRDKEALQNLCVSQVEKLMELWNNNDEFRKEYVRCNVKSTVWRLRTLDGRGLGPDEEPPVIPELVNDRVAKDHTVSTSTSVDQTQEKAELANAEKANDKPVAKAAEQQKNQTSKSEKHVKSVPPASGSTTASTRDKIDEAGEEKSNRTKEEEEAARKAEELRKEEEAVAKREQLRLEEIAKAKEALERKKRKAEKAQARAAVRAQKEAEEKEKEREKREKKKERRKGTAAAAAATGDVSVADETGSAPASESPAETPKESENKEKPVTVTKRLQRPSQYTKQIKAKSIPPPLRNRGKRRMQPWMWVLLTCLVIFALFLIGNYNFSFNFGLQRFNF